MFRISLKKRTKKKVNETNWFTITSSSSTDFTIWVDCDGNVVMDSLDQMQVDFDNLFNKFFDEYGKAGEETPKEVVARWEREDVLAELMR